MNKLPKSTSTHNNDKAAFTYLQSVLPEHWKITKLGDLYSGIEYGQDALVTVTQPDPENPDEEFVTGVEFTVQNKVSRDSLQGDFIPIKLRVSTLNLLEQLSHPVLLHCYHKPTKVGYWMWLDTFLKQRTLDSFQHQEEVTLHISLSNVLDAAAISQIREYATDRNHQFNLLKNVILANQSDPYLKYSFHQDANGWKVLVQSKQGIPSIPVRLVVTPDENSRDAFIEAVEQGTFFEGAGQIQAIGLPKWFHPYEANEKLHIVWHPPSSAQSIPMRFRFFIVDTVVLEIPFISMKHSQLGTKITKLKGRLPKYPINIEIDANLYDESLNINVNIDADNKTPQDWVKCLQLLKGISNADRAVITLLETDRDVVLPTPSSEVFSVTQERWLRLSDALVTINNRTNLAILLPESFSGEELEDAEGIAELMRDGKCQRLIGWPPNRGITIALKLEDARKMLTENASQNQLTIHYSDVEWDVFGTKIKSGVTEFVLVNCEAFDAKTRQRVDLSSIDNETIDVIFIPNRELSFTKCSEWLIN